MTNFEFYREKIKKMVADNVQLFAIINDVICDCDEFANCNNCFRCNEYNECEESETFLMKWLLAEHVEKPKLTKRERAFCELLEPSFYIARDATMELFVYEYKPYKGGVNWETDNRYMSTRLLDISFSFITNEDEEPWKVEDLLKLEVE